jgi:hypothetical protein
MGTASKIWFMCDKLSALLLGGLDESCSLASIQIKMMQVKDFFFRIVWRIVCEVVKKSTKASIFPPLISSVRQDCKEM